MEGLIETVYLIFSKIAPRWKRRDGFLCAAIIIFLIQLFILIQSYGTIKSIWWASSPYFYSACLALFLFVPHFVHFVAWKLISGRLIYSRRPYKVGFCIQRTDVASESYYRDTLSRLQHLLRGCNLLEQFELIDIGSDVIRDNSGAKSFRERKGLTVLFYGAIFSGLENGELVCEHKLGFEWDVPPWLNPNLRTVAHIDASFFTQHRDWNIRASSSKRDQDNVADSYHEIVLFLTMLSQVSDRSSVNHNIDLLETLAAHLQVKTASDRIQVDDKSQTVTMPVPVFRKGRVASLLRDLYEELARQRIVDRDYRGAVSYFSKAASIPAPSNINVKAGLALCFYRLGDNLRALETTKDVNKEHKNHPVYLINMAFFRVREGKYGSALDFYRRFVFHEEVSQPLLSSVLDFLYEHTERFSDEIGYQFAVGILNFAFADRVLGKSELVKFMTLSKGKDEYAAMHQFAQRMVTLGMEGLLMISKRSLSQHGGSDHRQRQKRRRTGNG